MRDERGLDLERADAVARRHDHVVASPLEAQPAALVFGDLVTRVPGVAVATVFDAPRTVGGTVDVLA